MGTTEKPNTDSKRLQAIFAIVDSSIEKMSPKELRNWRKKRKALMKSLKARRA